jgi:hypothetical protein
MADGLFNNKWYKATNPKEQFLASRDTTWAEKYGGVVPFYPQQRYIDKNLAPELGMPASNIEALAAANQVAKQNKLMSPYLIERMLPTLLVEGAMGTRGWGYPDTPKWNQLLEKAGLPPSYEEAVKQRKTLSDFDRQVWDAKMMHAMMAAKSVEYGDQLAIERWNGKGKTIRGADAENHARKVQELTSLLANPKNKEMMNTWQTYLKRYESGPPQQVTESPPSYTWADENLPGLVSPVVNAVSEAAGSVKQTMQNAQNTIRNWTAPTEPLQYQDPFGFTIK